MKKLTALLLAAALLLTCSACRGGEEAQSESMRDITTFELVQEMGYGINLLQSRTHHLAVNLPAGM